MIYVGQTARPLRTLIAEHLNSIKKQSLTSVAKHFTSCCNLNHFSFTALEHCPNREKRLRKENKWIERLSTLNPQGLNEEKNSFTRSFRLILPYSHCSKRIFSMCRAHLNAKVSAGFRANANLRRMLKKT